MKIFHERLKETLKQKKVSQNELAKRIGVRQNAVWEWCNVGTPSVERLKQICEILNVSADFLLGLSINTGGGADI